MSDTCGLTSCEPLATWDPDSSCWKTSEATSLWALTLSSLTLPAWGGLHDGELCEHPTPEHLTGEPAYSSLPTPVADNSRGLPQTGTDYSSLPNAVIGLLPTPAVNDMGRGKTVEAWDAWTDKMKAAHGNGNGHGKSLEIEAQRLLPTPTVQQGRNETSGRQPGSQHHEGKTLMDWAWEISEWPGATTASPSPDGSVSSDDQHPHLLSLDALEIPA